MKAETKKLLFLLFGIAVLVVITANVSNLQQGSIAGLRWQETGGWQVAPEGYAINDGGVRFIEESAYNYFNEVVGFRWKVRYVSGLGYAYYGYVDALVPQDGVSYEWSSYPVGWEEDGNQYGVRAWRYADSTTMVWVYAPVTKTTPTPTPTSTPSPTLNPTPTPSSNPSASPTPSATPSPSATIIPNPNPPEGFNPAWYVVVALAVAGVLVFVLRWKRKRR